jgi:hypothetical protein
MPLLSCIFTVITKVLELEEGQRSDQLIRSCSSESAVKFIDRLGHSLLRSIGRFITTNPATEKHTVCRRRRTEICPSEIFDHDSVGSIFQLEPYWPQLSVYILHVGIVALVRPGRLSTVGMLRCARWCKHLEF